MKNSLNEELDHLNKVYEEEHTKKVNTSSPSLSLFLSLLNNVPLFTWARIESTEAVCPATCSKARRKVMRRDNNSGRHFE